MADFKFSCPQCGQHIACDTGYAGMQINCPSCQQAILVPQMAGAPPLPPPIPAAPHAPSALSTRQTTAAPAAGQRFTGAPGSQPPKAKSNALRNTLIIVGSVVVLACLGAGGWFGYSAVKKHQGKKGNPAAQVAAPTAAATMQALGILTKVHAAYTNMNTVSASGTITLFLDLSNLTMADVNPAAAANAKNANRRPPGMPKYLTNTTEMTIKRASTNRYCMAWEAVSKVDRTVITNTFASWSSDKGKFMFSDSHQKNRAFYQQLPDTDPNNDKSALVAKSLSQFFADPAQINKVIKDLGQTGDEMVNGTDCYTVTAKVLGQKVKIWVDKTTYLISQWQIVLGGQITDADIDDAFDAVSTAANLPRTEVDMAKPQVKKIAPAMAKIRGTITSTTREIEINPTLSSDDFNYPVPAGVRLTTMPQGGPRNARTGTATGTGVAPAASTSRNACINNLRQIDGAKNEWALEKGKANGTPVTEDDIKPYLKGNAIPTCPGGGKYTLGKVGDLPTCSIEGHVLP
jgi:general secretion pathway protein G